MRVRLERCSVCDMPTGRAGLGDDSLYFDETDGPYCLECYENAAARKRADHWAEVGPKLLAALVAARGIWGLHGIEGIHSTMVHKAIAEAEEIK